ncbi:hypothetical protein HDU98_006560 [Podochytrium sp. JEL0797]|nr:hypothetical protein HDU98_006560 [Podochytrium sp. JEL0797]
MSQPNPNSFRSYPIGYAYPQQRNTMYGNAPQHATFLGAGADWMNEYACLSTQSYQFPNVSSFSGPGGNQGGRSSFIPNAMLPIQAMMGHIPFPVSGFKTTCAPIIPRHTQVKALPMIASNDNAVSISSTPQIEGESAPIPSKIPASSAERVPASPADLKLPVKRKVKTGFAAPRKRLIIKIPRNVATSSKFAAALPSHLPADQQDILSWLNESIPIPKDSHHHEILRIPALPSHLPADQQDILSWLDAPIPIHEDSRHREISSIPSLPTRLPADQQDILSWLNKPIPIHESHHREISSTPALPSHLPADQQDILYWLNASIPVPKQSHSLEILSVPAVPPNGAPSREVGTKTKGRKTADDSFAFSTVKPDAESKNILRRLEVTVELLRGGLNEQMDSEAIQSRVAALEEYSGGLNERGERIGDRMAALEAMLLAKDTTRC